MIAILSVCVFVGGGSWAVWRNDAPLAAVAGALAYLLLLLSPCPGLHP